MEFKEFRKEYGTLSKQELLGLVYSQVTDVGNSISDRTLENYCDSLKALSTRKKIYKDIIEGKENCTTIGKRYGLSRKTIKYYKHPLILFGIIEATPKEGPKRWKMRYEVFQEKLGSLPKKDLMNLVEKIYDNAGKKIAPSTVENYAGSIRFISNTNKKFYNDLTNSWRTNKEIADKYDYSLNTISKLRKPLLLFGIAKHKTKNKRNNEFNVNLDDLLASNS